MTDQDIVKSVLAGDQQAYAKLVEKHQTGLFYHVFTLVKDSDTSEDICQEAFIKAFGSLRSYNPKYAFSTWLFRIATNKALDHLRRTSPLPLDNLPDQAKEPIEEEEDPRLPCLRANLTTLPPKYRAVITLYYWQDHSYEDIATIMNIPVGTVRTWLHRSKQSLKENCHGLT